MRLLADLGPVERAVREGRFGLGVGDPLTGRGVGEGGEVAELLAAWLAVELLWVEPTRSARAIALQKVAIVSEPRADLEPVATVRPGVEVEVLGGGDGSFVRVRAADRSGYAARDGFAIVQ